MTRNSPPGHLIEPLEARIAPAVDLMVTIDLLKLPDPAFAVPGDDGSITYTITNVGDTPFQTNQLDVNVWLSKQTGPISSPIANDISLHAKYRTVVDGQPNMAIKLGPGDSVKKTVKIEMPDYVLNGGRDPTFVFGETPFNFSPGTGFHLIVEVDPNFAFDSGAHANNHAASAPFEWRYQFGQVHGRNGVGLNFIESGGGTLGSFELSGQGTGEFLPFNSPQPGEDLSFTGTTAGSAATASVFKAPGLFGDNLIRLGLIGSLGPMKSLRFPTADVSGNISIPGTLGALVVRDLGPNTTVQIGGAPGDLPLAFDARRVDGVQLTASAGIVSLDAVDWLKGSAGSITAPFLNDLEITGSKVPAVAGDFGANVNLNGANAKGFALGKAKIVGAIKNSTFTSTGAGRIGDIAAVSAENWTLNAQGSAEDIFIAQSVLGVTSPGLKAKSFSSIKVGGTLGNHIIATGDNGKMMGIKLVQAKTIDGITIAAGTAGIEKVLTGGWDNGGNLNARWIKSILAVGGPGSPASGDFTAAVNITRAPGDPVPKSVKYGLGQAGIGGALKGAIWNVKSDVQTIVAGSVEAGWSFVGAAEAPGVLRTQVGELVVKGANGGAFTADSYRDVDFQGDFTGTLTVKGVTTASPTLYKFTAATVTGGKINADGYVDSITVGQWTGGNITVDKFNTINIKGTKNLPGNLANAIVTVTGTEGGVIQVNGALGATTINAPNASILSITADEWNGGDLTAQSLRFLHLVGDPARSIAGDLFGASIRLDDPNAKLNELKVKGFIRNETIQVFGDVGVVEVLGLEYANISVAGQHRIDTLNITGTDAATRYYIGSQVDVAAGIIGSVVVRNVNPDFGSNEFGITADRIEKYVRFEGGVQVAPPLTNLDVQGTFDPEGDYRVTIK